MATIKIPAIKSTKSETTHVITYVDGIVITLSGSNTIATRKAAYEKAYLSAHPPVEPKPPVEEPSDYIKISHAEFCGLSDIKGKKYRVFPGLYSQTADHNNVEDCIFDLSGVTVQGCYQAIRISGRSIGNTYKGLSLKNVEGYQIECVRSSKMLYTGVSGTFVDRLTFDGLYVDGGGQVFHADGDLINGKVWGLLKNFKLANASIKNISYGDIVYLGAGMDAQFENVTFDNINATQNNHNGVIRVHGNLIAKNIKATNYQGNLFRNWLYSVEGVKTTSISNSIGYRSRKYSLIELQMTPGLAENGAKPGNAEIFNNTAISMATSKDWDGQLIDIYNTGRAGVKSIINIYNNLGADLIASQGRAIIPEEMANKMFDPGITEVKFSGNRYFTTINEAVENTTTLKSKISGIGAQ